VDDAFAQDLSPQPSAMDQTAHDAMLREFFQILARLAKARTAHEHRTDAKFTVDEMIQWDTRGRNVTAGVRGSELDSERPPAALSTPRKSASMVSISITVTSRPPWLDVFEW
jgi:hypothetical protein